MPPLLRPREPFEVVTDTALYVRRDDQLSEDVCAESYTFDGQTCSASTSCQALLSLDDAIRDSSLQLPTLGWVPPLRRAP